MTSDRQQLPVFYVNLASRPDRRAFMEEQFARLGIEAERFEAVPADAVPQEILQGVSRHRVREIAPGDLACGLSHQGVWAQIAHRRLPVAVVLEDDAVISPELLAFLAPENLNRLPDFDLIKIETRRDEVLLGLPVGKVASSDLQELQSSHTGCAGYIISLEAAQRSVADPAINDDYMDRFLFGKRGPHLLRSRILQATPSPIVQLDRLVPGQDKSTLPTHARSDLTRSRARRGAYGSAAGLIRTVGDNLDHAMRLLRLFARDPQVLTRARRRVPFADEVNPTE